MNRKMTYSKLMEKVEDGYAEIVAWGLNCNYADVIFYTQNGRSKRETIEVTKIPADVE